MIYCLVKFGTSSKNKKDEAERIVDDYLSSMLLNWQIYADYYLTWMSGFLCSHVFLALPDSFKNKYSSKSCKEKLNKIIAFFGQKPDWTINDDDIKRRNARWQSANFLYLRTDAFEKCSPIFRGNDGEPIPPCLIPISDQDRDYLYTWSRSYYHHDNIWFGSGQLEMDAYKQIADPKSELMESARYYCGLIEKATGIETYCYLIRYYGRNKDERKRVCPLCGEKWSTGSKSDKNIKFWEFHFRCKKCKLVSHIADSYEDERHARIGEYKIKRTRDTEQHSGVDAEKARIFHM